MVPLRDEKSHITFVHAHTPHTHTELEHIVKGSHEHVVEVMTRSSGGFRIWEGEGARYGRVHSHCN